MARGPDEAERVTVDMYARIARQREFRVIAPDRDDTRRVARLDVAADRAPAARSRRRNAEGHRTASLVGKAMARSGRLHRARCDRYPSMTHELAGIPSAGRGEVRFDLLGIEGREAGRAKFQRLVTDIVKATRTDAREIAANPGDWGIDTFVGQLAGGEIDIWQSKYFVDGMAESQHRQVRDSFHSARRHADERGYRVHTWTLAMPATMDAPTAQWWDAWRARTSRRYGIDIELWQEADLRSRLLRDEARGVRRQYFGDPSGDREPLVLDLIVPRRGSGESLFAYADRAIELIGRGAELAELSAFANSALPFAWWTWTGPAGAGKSRLALEICQQLGKEWHAGFLSEVPKLEPGVSIAHRPTFIVVDYAAQRVEALSNFLLQLARFHRDASAPIRILLLERFADGAWWTRLQRLHRTSESADLLATMYALPRGLDGLGETDMTTVIRATGTYLNEDLSPSTIGEIMDRVDELDDLRRPLFVAIATLDSLRGSATGVRETVLHELLTRQRAQVATFVSSSGLLRQVETLLTLASATGGLDASTYSRLVEDPSLSKLLPASDADISTDQFHEFLAGVEPDLGSATG